MNSIGANYPGQAGRITVEYNGKTYEAELEDGAAMVFVGGGGTGLPPMDEAVSAPPVDHAPCRRRPDDHAV